jgi:hypothetical protein
MPACATGYTPGKPLWITETAEAAAGGGNPWAALLWRQLMGTTVLDPVVPDTPNVYVYAHTLRDRPGGVAVLVLNVDRRESRTLEITAPAERYTLTAGQLTSGGVELNGAKLELGADDELPVLAGESEGPGVLTFGPTTITFLASADTGNR